jgi:hypothetical protein
MPIRMLWPGSLVVKEFQTSMPERSLKELSARVTGMDQSSMISRRTLESASRWKIMVIKEMRMTGL